MPNQNKNICKTVTSALEEPSTEEAIGTVLDPFGGVIKLPISLINYKGRDNCSIEETIFDPEDYLDEIPMDEMSRFTSNQIDVRKLASYKEYGIVYLNRIQSGLNRLVAAIENYNADNHIQPAEARKFLQKAYTDVEDTIIQTLVGKGSLIARNVAGIRLPFSMMTPAAGTHLCEHTQVIIPRSEAVAIKAWDGDIIMVHREPLLHGPSMVFLTACIVDDEYADSSRIPWAVFDGMNADCDGDLIYLTNISKHLKECDSERRGVILNEIHNAREEDIKTYKYTASLCLLNDDENVEYSKAGYSSKDISERVDDSTGLSFGVEDIFDRTDDHVFLDVLEEHLDIDPEKVLKYSKDLSREEWAGDLKATAEALAYTKRGLGIVGAIGNYALIISTYRPECIPAAVAIKEGLSQTVLDAKHGEDLDHINETLAALTKSEDFKDATTGQRIKALVKNGFDKDVITPLMRVLGDVGIVNYVYAHFPNYLMATSGSNILSLFIRCTDQACDTAGLGNDIGAWWDNAVVPALEE